MDNDGSTNGYPFLKSAYYTGKLLHATDFIREQKYGNSKLEFINRKFHGWGIIDGLEVDTGQDGRLYLSGGSAIDPRGRILAVPEDKQVKPAEIEGLRPESAHEFILGIRYAEQPVETERAYLEQGERCQPSVIAETYTLRAYEREEFQKLKRDVLRHEDILMEERVLYESGVVRLAAWIPKIVPADSLFRIRIQMRTVQESNVRIKWHGMARLQGAVFAQSGEPLYVLEEDQAMCSGSLQREWEICTEENRALPIMLEINNLEIAVENTQIVEIPTCQFQIETAVSYDQAIRRHLQNRTEQDVGEDWVPLACLRLEEAAGQDYEKSKYIFSLLEESNVRFLAIRPCEQEILRRITEENGILDIRWRRLMKHIWRPPLSPCSGPSMPPGPPAPEIPFSPNQPFRLPEDMMTEQRFRELVDADRKSRISRGIVIIPVPKRYRKGQVLFSEEISHGFPGEEVFLWCGRVWEERSYAYWERGKKRYKVIHGEEELFPDVCDGQEIVRQAVLQHVEDGTFQIALTLNRKRRRNRSREVALSWIAVRSV